MGEEKTMTDLVNAMLEHFREFGNNGTTCLLARGKLTRLVFVVVIMPGQVWCIGRAVTSTHFEVACNPTAIGG